MARSAAEKQPSTVRGKGQRMARSAAEKQPSTVRGKGQRMAHSAAEKQPATVRGKGQRWVSRPGSRVIVGGTRWSEPPTQRQ